MPAMAFARLTVAALVLLALALAACGGSDKASTTKTTRTTPPGVAQTVGTPSTTATAPAGSGGADSSPAPATTTPSDTGGTPSSGAAKAGGTGGVYPNRPPAKPGSDPNQNFQQYCKQNPRSCGD